MHRQINDEERRIAANIAKLPDLAAAVLITPAAVAQWGHWRAGPRLGRQSDERA
jgi:hypothetical protein